MTYKGFISVDLNEVSDEKRKKFYDELAKYGWLKLSLTTCWKASSTSNGWDTESAFRDRIKKQIQGASSAADIPWRSVEYGFQTGSYPVEVKQINQEAVS